MPLGTKHLLYNIPAHAFATIGRRDIAGNLLDIRAGIGWAHRC